MILGGEHGILSWNSFRKKNRDSFTENGNLALYENEPAPNFLNPYFSGYITPGPAERAASKQAKVSSYNIIILLTM